MDLLGKLFQGRYVRIVDFGVDTAKHFRHQCLDKGDDVSQDIFNGGEGPDENPGSDQIKVSTRSKSFDLSRKIFVGYPLLSKSFH